jgi:uncharacterized SAM-binding protein YcdF (DUF218 family)
MTKAGRWLLIAVLLAGAAWLGGFAAFDRAARRAAREPPPADAIVALTGGADRVDTALMLLAAGRAPLLLISGVGGGTDLPELSRHAPLAPGQAARVTLGRTATTTVGNAMETAVWARARGVRSLIVVTAGYHMPRAMVEIGRALPGVALYAMPVRPPALRGGMEISTLRILANEYNKYLAVRLGLTRKSGMEAS